MSENFDHLRHPWPEPNVERVRDAKQTFIVKHDPPWSKDKLPLPNAVFAASYDGYTTDLSLVDITQLARDNMAVIITYEPGIRTKKALATLVIQDVPAKET